jgi:hypothetical protein
MAGCLEKTPHPVPRRETTLSPKGLTMFHISLDTQGCIRARLQACRLLSG